MKLSKILKFFKRGAKASGRRKSGGTVSEYKWPSGISIGVYGHRNSGKTVYFTTLNEESKVSKPLQISPTDTRTANEFLANYREIWGLGTSSGAGTVVDLRGEQKFPEPTESGRVLQFNAILGGEKKLPVATYDYNGDDISLRAAGEESEKVNDFMLQADGILFFFDPKILGAELECQAHVASFVTMLERLCPLSSRLPIPIGLVITKSDVLPGFKSENQTILVEPQNEQVFSEKYEFFLERVLSSNRIASNSDWAGSVRNVLIRLKEFLKIVVGRTLDFQIFFISSTGQTPEKVGEEVGRSIYRPPRVIRPIGIQEPFYWILKSVSRSSKISKLRKTAKVAALLGTLWIVAYSIPHLYHFSYLLPRTTALETNILEANRNDITNLSSADRGKVKRKYDSYARSFVVKWLFPKFAPHATSIAQVYGEFNEEDALRALDNTIAQFSQVIKDPELWPTLNVSDSSLNLTEGHERIESDLMQHQQTGDSTSTRFLRSKRVLNYWHMFKQSIANASDTTSWSRIIGQVEVDRISANPALTRAENELMDELTNQKVEKVVRVESKQAGVELGSLKDDINSNNDPSYRLGEAVTVLQKLHSRLQDGPDKTSVANYLAAAKRWQNRRQSFKFRIDKLPDDGVLYIEVTNDGAEPKWEEFGQKYEGYEYSIDWKIGDDIHIGFCLAGEDCNRGAKSSDKIVITRDLAIFDLEKDLHFTGIDKHVTLTFLPNLQSRLPTLK